MSTVYDWAPFFDAINKSTSDWGQRAQYQGMIDKLVGQPTTTPGSVGSPAMPGAQTQLNPTLPQLPGQPAPTPQAPVNLMGPDIAAQAATGPSTAYSGMAGQALGSNMASILPMLRGLPPSVGLPFLLNATAKNMDRQQGIADKKISPMTDAEAQAAGLRPGGVYGKDVSGNIVPIQESDLMSEPAIKQKLDVMRQQGLIAAENPLTLEQKANKAHQDATLAETQKHDRATEFAAQHPFGASMGGVDANGAPLTGDAFLESLAKQNPGLAAQVKAIGTYRQLAPMRGSKEGIALENLVNQYNPGWDSTQYATKQKARNDYGSGVQGKSIVAINNAMAHLDLLGKLADAMGNGDIQMVNQVKQAYEQATGSAAPTTFDAVRNIAAQEVVKSVVPGGGGVAEREAAAADFKRANSPQQIHGAISGVKGLFSGQLGNYKRQYTKLTGLQDFNDFLSPETTGLMGMPISQAVNGGANSGGGDKFVEGKVYIDAHGNKAKYHNGQWVAP